MAPTSSESQLSALHAHYTLLINSAVGAGRMDLVEDLAGEYEDEALELLLSLQDDQPGDVSRPAEMLELGSDWPTWRAARRSLAARFRALWRR
jgi:hypothetical protein